MKKTMRRLLALALSLIAIHVLATGIFAASDFWSGECGGEEVELYADISRYGFSTDICTPYGHGFSRCDVDITYTYYPMPAGSNAVTKTFSKDQYFSSQGLSDAVREYTVEKDLSGDCFSMISATFNYELMLNRITSIYVSPPYSLEY